MERRREPPPRDRTTAAAQGEVHADARARDEAATGTNVPPASGRASGGLTATDGVGEDRAGGRFRVRPAMPSWRRPAPRDVLAAGDAERERIERDLHDGVQQQLTALRIRLSLAAERFGERGEDDASMVLQEFSDGVDHVIDDVRNLARGIYPAVLGSDGLPAALLSAGVHSARPVTVQASDVRRCRPDAHNSTLRPLLSRNSSSQGR